MRLEPQNSPMAPNPLTSNSAPDSPRCQTAVMLSAVSQRSGPGICKSKLMLSSLRVMVSIDHKCPNVWSESARLAEEET